MTTPSALPLIHVPRGLSANRAEVPGANDCGALRLPSQTNRFLPSAVQACIFVAMILWTTGRIGHAFESDSADGSLASELMVYVGTYTGGSSKGIYLYHMDLATGRVEPKGLAAEVSNPSFLTTHPNRRFLYAVSEVGNFSGESGGAVSAFAIDPDSGRLTLMNHKSTKGAAPCHLVIDQQGKNVLVANYGGGNVAVLPVSRDGRVGEATSVVQHQGASVLARQKSPHAHAINLDAAGRFAFASDLGLDKVMIYRFDADQGTLQANDPPWVSIDAGAGPRHFAFHPSGQFAYVINELNSTVTAFRYEPSRGALTVLESVTTLPAGYDQKSYTAEIVVAPSGKFLYGSNRGHDSIVIFAIHEETGKLSLVGHESTQGKFPRNFAIDPTGSYLWAANQNSDSIVIFRIDAQSGELEPTGTSIEVPAPVCVEMIPVVRAS